MLHVVAQMTEKQDGYGGYKVTTVSAKHISTLVFFGCRYTGFEPSSEIQLFLLLQPSHSLSKMW